MQSIPALFWRLLSPKPAWPAWQVRQAVDEYLIEKLRGFALVQKRSHCGDHGGRREDVVVRSPGQDREPGAGHARSVPPAVLLAAAE
jgi:hypothetical protein